MPANNGLLIRRQYDAEILRMDNGHMNLMKREINLERQAKWFRYCFFGLTLFLIIMYAIGESLLPNENKTLSLEDIRYSDSIYYVDADGEKTEIFTPYILDDIDRGETYTLELDVPDEANRSDTIVFWTAWQVVHVHNKNTGEQLYSYETSDSKWLGNNVTSRYHAIALNEEMRGQTLVFEMSSDSVYTGIVGEFFYGNSLQVWAAIMAKEAPTVIIAVLLNVIGLGITMICEVLGKFVFRRHLSIANLGWTLTNTGSFILFEAILRQFLFKNVSWVSYLAITLLLMIAYSQIIFINEVQKMRHQYFFSYCIAILMLVLFGVYIFHFAGIVDIIQAMPLIYTVALLGGVCILITFAIEFKNGFIEEYSFAAIGFVIYFISCLLEVAFMFTRMANHTGVVMACGLSVYVLMSVYDGTIRFIQTEVDRSNKIKVGEQKSNFLAQVSHEIRTPINGVLGMNEMILRESGEENIKNYAYDIENLGNLLLALINDLLDFSKIEEGKMEIMPVEYELSSTLDGVISTLRPKALEKHLDFKVEVDEEIPEYLYGDEIRLRQIIINIVNNAIKYTEKGSITMSVDKVFTEHRKIDLIIKVTDTGKGIKKEDIPYLFDAFTRVDERANAHIEGTGLGLAISAKFAELMNGKITVESEYTKGSCFTVTVPQRVVRKEAIGDFEKRVEKSFKGREAYRESFTAPDVKILVVDDNKTNLKLAELLLKKTKVQVTTAMSGQETLEKLEKENFDLILLDHMMPEMDGIQTLEEINKRYPERAYPVIALTANAVVGARENYLKQGFEDYMSKPINGKALEAMLIKWLPSDKVQIES
ncbi:MAG: response regulator [Lachnospiraceae bacterium]|nr:response regulator [Lachnospiraceae bacterium]